MHQAGHATPSPARRILCLAAALIGLLPTSPARADAEWDAVLDKARGQTVHFNGWAGDERINDFIQWAAGRVRELHGIELRHVKVADIAETVGRIVAEKTAGRSEGGSADLLWINGENFARMKENGLLFGPFAQRLPNFRFVDTRGKPTTVVDFTVPTDGYEAPWGMSQIVLMYDTARVTDPPRTMRSFLGYARAHPGRLTYPQPPDFIGTTFLKQALLELAPDAAALSRPASDETFGPTTEPLWAWLDALHPNLWRVGRAFPRNGPAARQLFADGETDFALSFHPGEASSLIAQGLLPHSVRTYVLAGGTIGNTHFVAIPFNAAAKEAAMVVADFLLSPEAQARKLDPVHWGDMTVLDVAALPPEQQALFAAVPRGMATLSDTELGKPLPEPHPSWTTRIEETWRGKYER
jgi:putative thiamine transport system substrate-binding protein